MTKNDSELSPKIATKLPYSDKLDATEATESVTDPPCRQYGTGTVWYQYTAKRSVRLVADTFGSDYDTTLYVGTSDGAVGWGEAISGTEEASLAVARHTQQSVNPLVLSSAPGLGKTHLARAILSEAGYAPAEIDALFASFVDRLTGPLRDILDVASVQGVTFSVDLVMEMLGLTRAWATEFGPSQITVNNVAPGANVTVPLSEQDPSNVVGRPGGPA